MPRAGWLRRPHPRSHTARIGYATVASELSGAILDIRIGPCRQGAVGGRGAHPLGSAGCYGCRGAGQGPPWVQTNDRNSADISGA